jgi:spore coat polysaccharide biosynthesis predicted glycosyltransferase SpsG
MIIFRTGASQETGFGHLNRSTYLASLLKSKCEVLFCVNKDRTVTRFLEEKKFSYCTVKDLERRGETGFSSVIFDLRDFDEDDLRLLHHAKKNDKKTVQITDLGLSKQDVDYIIDGSIVALYPYDEHDEEEPGTRLIGPGYSILHTRFRHFHKVQRKYRQKIRKVFICFGGGLKYRDLRKAVDLSIRHGYEVKIAPGFYLKKGNIKTLHRIYPGIRFVGHAPSLARSFFEADVALITSGIAAYEAAAVGTPALYFYYHDEQKSIASAFEKHGAGLVISNIDDLLSVNWIDKMKELTCEKRIRMGLSGKETVDARGVYRVIEFFEKNRIV